MRAFRIMFRVLLPFAVIALVGICLVGYFRFTSVYLGFKNKSAKYHEDFAEACDLVLAHYPPSTNMFVKLPVTDPSLPKIISDTHPAEMGVGSNIVGVLVHPSHMDGLAVVWKPLDGTLSINSGDGPEKIIYVRRQRAP
jgi:hypothetical protein